MTAQRKPDYETLSDAELAALVGGRDPAAVRLVTERNNQRLFRTAWSILKNRVEAEDAVQSAYCKAFAAIDGFEARSSLSTWLTRIVMNEALGRARAIKRRNAHLDGRSVLVLDEYREKLMQGSMSATTPDGTLALGQIRELLEAAIARLPRSFRLVFVLREIEDMSVADVAEALGIAPATVKTRHLRARRRLQEELAPQMNSVLHGTFPFAGADCERITEGVIAAFCGERAGA